MRVLGSEFISPKGNRIQVAYSKSRRQYVILSEFTKKGEVEQMWFTPKTFEKLIYHGVNLLSVVENKL